MKIDLPTVGPDSVLLRIQVEGTCLTKSNTFTWKPKILYPPRVDADGTVSLDTFVLNRVDGGGDCDAIVHVIEVTSGQVDPLFAGGVSGSFDAEGSQHVDFPIHIAW